MRFLLLACALTSACATVLRPGTREVVVRAPPDVKVLHGGTEMPLASRDGMLVATLPRSASAITLETSTQVAQTPLHGSASPGWVLADILTGVWPAIIDLATGAWNNFDAVDTSVLRWDARQGAAGPVLAERSSTPGAAPAPAPANHRALLMSGKLAVLDFRSFTKDLRPENVRYFTDVVRGASLKAAPDLQVMTRENLLVLLQSTGKDAANCEGECEVDTGRRIGADALITGEVLKVGSRYKISLKLHETHEGRLLSTGVASGKSIDELDEALQSAAVDLLAPR